MALKEKYTIFLMLFPFRISNIMLYEEKENEIASQKDIKGTK